ncbi:MAG: hypothetical protein Q8T13_04895 [Acidobacteriota bacterium]|nr:hypothetical protein [Acidobacteriota bacterium]
MTPHTLDIGGVEIEAILEESHAFGVSWVASLAVGLRKMNDLTVGGFYDDTASTGPNAVYNDVADGPSDSTRTAKTTWGGTKTTSVETWIKKFSRIAARGQITKYATLLAPTGTVTEA